MAEYVLVDDREEIVIEAGTNKDEAERLAKQHPELRLWEVGAFENYLHTLTPYPIIGVIGFDGVRRPAPQDSDE